MPDGKLTAELAEIRERATACDGGFSMDRLHYIKSAGDVPRLVKALEAVLAEHASKPVPGTEFYYCPACTYMTFGDDDVADGESAFMPTDACEVRYAITSALTGTETI